MSDTPATEITAPTTINLPIPKTAEELRIFLILEDDQLKAAYKDLILQTTLNATREQVESRNVPEKKEATSFRPETLI